MVSCFIEILNFSFTANSKMKKSENEAKKIRYAIHLHVIMIER